VGKTAARVGSPIEHGWVRPALVSGIVAGILSNLVLTVTRVAVSIGWYLFVASFVGSWGGDTALRALGVAWVALKVSAYPFVGERSLVPGFDAGIVSLGIVARLVFAVASGALFGLVAHGRSRITTVVFGLLCGVAAWVVSSIFICPPISQSGGTIVLFVPYGLALAVTFRWYQRRLFLRQT
jgi:hypothetical protein